jgi:hypothetical protein
MGLGSGLHLPRTPEQGVLIKAISSHGGAIHRIFTFPCALICIASGFPP